MNREQKAAAVEEVATQIQESEAVFAVDYRGISVPQAAELRVKLNEAGARFRVVKNTLTQLSADKAGAETLKELLEGPTAFTFVAAEGGDVALAAKALAQFRRETELLEFKGGVMGGEAISAEQIAALSRLPARDVLHEQLVGDDRLADHRPGARAERADRGPRDPAAADRRAGARRRRRGAARRPAARPRRPPAEEAEAEAARRRLRGRGGRTGNRDHRRALRG